MFHRKIFMEVYYSFKIRFFFHQMTLKWCKRFFEVFDIFLTLFAWHVLIVFFVFCNFFVWALNLWRCHFERFLRNHRGYLLGRSFKKVLLEGQINFQNNLKHFLPLCIKKLTLPFLELEVWNFHQRLGFDLKCNQYASVIDYKW